jgi:hypothetical protein
MRMIVADENLPVTPPVFQEKARKIVYEYVLEHLDKTDKHVTFGIDEVYVVMWSKVLQNWKALVSTTLPDGMYYEVTWNGDMNCAYLDAYKKFDNRTYVDDPYPGLGVPQAAMDQA